MSEEEKGEKNEKKKEKKPITVVEQWNNISLSVTDTIRIQRELMQSNAVNTALQAARATQSFIQTAAFLKSFQGLNETLRANSQIIQQVYQTPGLKAMAEMQQQMGKLNADFVRASQIARSPTIQMPILTTQLKAIPPQRDTVIRSLVSQIEYLESELAKSKTENKELIRQLEEKRKELKQQYVS